jgi:hypothetical protein
VDVDVDVDVELNEVEVVCLLETFRFEKRFLISNHFHFTLPKW